MQRRQLDEIAQAVLDGGVDQHRLPEPLAAVDDPVADGVGIAEPVAERVAQLAGVERRAGSGELALDQRRVAVADQA